MTRTLKLGALVILLAAVAGRSNAFAQPAVTWLIFVDDLHLDFRNTGRLRTMVQTILKELPLEGEAVAMFASGPSRVSVGPTTDRAPIDNEVKKVIGNGLRVADIVAAPADPELRYRAALARARARQLIASASPTSARRTALIYISNGYASGTQAELPSGSAATVFALDARLLVGASDLDRSTWPEHWAATRDSLRALAAPSGGFVLEEGQSLAGFLDRVRQAMRQ